MVTTQAPKTCQPITITDYPLPPLSPYIKDDAGR